MAFSALPPAVRVACASPGFHDRQVGVPARRQLAAQALLPLGCEIGIRLRVRIEALLPLRLGALSPRSIARRKCAAAGVGNVEGAFRIPPERLLGERHLFNPERAAVRLRGALLVRRAVADRRLDDDQRRARRSRLPRP